jgi:alpha-amylase
MILVYNINNIFNMKRTLITALAALALVGTVANAKSTAEWKTRNIYQILTDRFQRSNGDKSGCDLHNYCGGNFDGIT